MTIVYLQPQTINTASTQSITIGVAGAQWSFDLDLDAGDASGTIYTYLQNEISGTFVNDGPFETITVTSGVYTNGGTKYTITNSGTPATYLIITWVPTGTPAGSISIKGLQEF